LGNLLNICVFWDIRAKYCLVLNYTLFYTMNRQQILTLLEQNGKRPSTLARSLGVTRGLMTQAIDGKGSREARLKIARVLSMPPSAIWGDIVSRQQIVVDNDAYYHPEFYN
jgi:lambda repressor-like predicted transcriptional regulator